MKSKKERKCILCDKDIKYEIKDFERRICFACFNKLYDKYILRKDKNLCLWPAI